MHAVVYSPTNWSDSLHATGLHNLAGSLFDQERYADAEALHARALSMRKKLLGEPHPDVSRSLSCLGLMLSYQERYEEAEPPMRAGLAMARETLGEEHPTVRLKSDYEITCVELRDWCFNYLREVIRRVLAEYRYLGMDKKTFVSELRNAVKLHASEFEQIEKRHFGS